MTQEPRGQELIRRYKNNFGIAHDVNISEEMILEHWELEKSLTKQLLESTSENRWETFERCYSTLYSEIEWLNKFTESNSCLSSLNQYVIWSAVIGEPPMNIYEIGSGKGGLIRYLASCGYMCKGSEITRERGKRHVLEHPNISWGISDGVHLNQFENANTYNVVISSQVIEHIHPDDLLEHFKGVQTILTNGGRYIFMTPHRFQGPSDISKVFKCEVPIGMHLKEYSYQELHDLLLKSGFTKSSAVWNIPQRISRLSGIVVKPKVSRFYFSYLSAVEKFISILPKQVQRRKAAFLLQCILFRTSMFIVALK